MNSAANDHDENLNPLFARPVPPELAFNEPRIVSDRPGLSQSIGRAMCRRLHNFAHHVASRPLLFVTVVFLLMNLVILLIFCCLRCRVRRMHRAAYKRQLRYVTKTLDSAQRLIIEWAFIKDQIIACHSAGAIVKPILVDLCRVLKVVAVMIVARA
ncbi:unnamed protein product [Dibothriocephalus latus]|uniref:Uncharacterized protein n=1 Tax=Dibothriocephalus latus TaxID=60516 RepID=A0A3P7KWL8_DIBLA|nr:unnamed protein product [Dibothriocephalus latus]